MNAQDLVHVNATMNGLTVIFLTAGFIYIRKGEWRKHRACMVSALVVSAIFLISYVIYKANAGFAKFGGEGIVRPIYFTILTVHIIGAFAIVPLVPMTVMRALKGEFERHRKLARITWPLWMYVGISGVVVYVMAVQIYPYTGG